MANNFFTNIPDYNGMGIYALINNRTGKMYIGASQNIHKRIMQHKYSPLSAIKSDINSGDTFRVEILEKLPSGSNQFDMFRREKHFIDSYNVIEYGYNKASTTCCSKEDLLKSLERFAQNPKMTAYILNIIKKRERPIPSQAETHKQYMENFVEIKVRMTPERREQVKAHAQAIGESTTAFINRAIDEAMQRDLEEGQEPD